MEKEIFQGAEGEAISKNLRAYFEQNNIRLTSGDMRVKVLFSEGVDAPTAEEMLVKILIGRMQ